MSARCMLVALLLAAPLPAAAQAADEPAVEVAQALLQGAAPVQRVPGSVVGTLDALVSAEVAGRLVRVAEVGERRREGEAIAVIDDRALKLQLQADEAAIGRLRARLDYLERQRQRLDALASGIAKAERDAAGAEREMIAQELRAAQAQRARTRLNLEHSRIVAPFDGVIVERARSRGEYIQIGEPVVRLVNTAQLEVSVRAPIAVSLHTDVGDWIKVSRGADSALLGVRALVPVGDARSRQIELRLSLPGASWTIGEAVEVELAAGPGTATIAVPRDALVLRNDHAHVFRVDANDMVHKLAVTTGAGHGSMVAVRGVEAGDRVVVRGGETLRDGQRVRVTGVRTASP